jgi:hypothetical protein
MTLSTTIYHKDTQQNNKNATLGTTLLMLGDVMLSVEIKRIMLSVIMLSVIMRSVFILSVFMLSVIMLSVIMLNVVGPSGHPTYVELILQKYYKFFTQAQTQ